MSLKTRIERLELATNEQHKIWEIELGDGRIARLTQPQIHEMLVKINGADTGPGPARSRRGPTVEH